jgi:hypothetical protein
MPIRTVRETLHPSTVGNPFTDETRVPANVLFKEMCSTGKIIKERAWGEWQITNANGTS